MRGRPAAAPTLAGWCAAAVLCVLYAGTAAPDLTWWDAPEFATAAHTLGIPHPPGTPLWVLLGRVFAWGAGGLGPVRAVTLLSVVAGALAGGAGAWLLARWIPPMAAVVAAVSAGAMAVPWQNATEVEVYAVAHAHALLLLVAGAIAGSARPGAGGRGRALLAYLAGLALPLHLSALVALPAALVLAWPAVVPSAPGEGAPTSWRTVRGRGVAPVELVTLPALALLGASAVAVLPWRAAQFPTLDNGHPVTLDALWAVLTRAQYAVAGVWPRQAPLWLQVANVGQWADWQVAWGWWPHPTPAWGRTGATVLWAFAGGWGARAIWRRDRRGAAALLTLVACGSLGVVWWLNLKAGPTFGDGVLPAGAAHEARERDYFFLLGFWGWGALAAAGVVDAGERAVHRLQGAALRQGARLAVLVAALLPLWANAPQLNRRREPGASWPRIAAQGLLDAVPTRGVLVAAGDHDAFPLWYLQQVEGRRPDAAVVVAGLLPTRWYRDELRRRRLLPAAMVSPWRGQGATLAAVGAEVARQGRPLRVSWWVAAADRRAVVPGVGWRLEGVVLAPDAAVPATATVVDRQAVRAAADRLPLAARAPIPPGADPAAMAWAAQWRCLQALAAGSGQPSARGAPELLVGACGGSYP